MQREDLAILLCFWLSLLSYVHLYVHVRPVHLFNTSCGLKILIKKDLIKNKGKSGGTVVYFYFGHASLKRERIFH